MHTRTMQTGIKNTNQLLAEKLSFRTNSELPVWGKMCSKGSVYAGDAWAKVYSYAARWPYWKANDGVSVNMRRLRTHTRRKTSHVFVCLCIAWFDIVHHQQNDTMESCPDISDHRLSFGFQTEMLIVVLVWSWQKPSLLYILDAVNQQHWYVCSEVYPFPLLFCIYL